MRMVEIEPLENGAHNNQEIYNVTPQSHSIPDGWAFIPDDMETPNFPFGEVEAEVVNGVMTVTKWTAGEIPPAPEPEPTEPSEEEDLSAMVVDHELRLSMLEMGLEDDGGET